MTPADDRSRPDAGEDAAAGRSAQVPGPDVEMRRPSPHAEPDDTAVRAPAVREDGAPPAGPAGETTSSRTEPPSDNGQPDDPREFSEPGELKEPVLPATPADRQIVLVTGISGSGKSVALHALEDAGYFCVDNLPPQLLPEFLRLESERELRHVAVAVDVRTAGSLPQLVPLLSSLRNEGVNVRPVFLDASTDTLVRRFSETRRPHPLSLATTGADNHRALIEAIELERSMLAGLRARSTILDTSQLRPVQLRQWMRDLVGAHASQLTLIFQSFAFKRGVPLDADLVFDVRILPNPYYLRELRPLTGRDLRVAQYLQEQPEVDEMLAQIEAFLRRWLPNFEDDQRSYLTVALGCTGGQHRSVYMAEVLAQRFASTQHTLLRHRELDARD